MSKDTGNDARTGSNSHHIVALSPSNSFNEPSRRHGNSITCPSRLCETRHRARTGYSIVRTVFTADK